MRSIMKPRVLRTLLSMISLVGLCACPSLADDFEIVVKDLKGKDVKPDQIVLPEVFDWALPSIIEPQTDRFRVTVGKGAETTIPLKPAHFDPKTGERSFNFSVSAKQEKPILIIFRRGQNPSGLSVGALDEKNLENLKKSSNFPVTSVIPYLVVGDNKITRKLTVAVPEFPIQPSPSDIAPHHYFEEGPWEMGGPPCAPTRKGLFYRGRR